MDAMDADRRTKASEQKFAQLKGVYEKFRTEHLAALQKFQDLQKRLEGMERDRVDREEEMRLVKWKLEEAERQRNEYWDRLDASSAREFELRSRLARANNAVVEMRRELASVRSMAAKGAAEKPLNLDKL